MATQRKTGGPSGGSNYRPPDPERFREYEEILDNRGTVLGFRLADGKTFYFDKNGGWSDEYGNYYNADGEPGEKPYDANDDVDDEGDDDYNDSLLDDYEIEGDDMGHDDFGQYDNTYEIAKKIETLQKMPAEKVTYTLLLSGLPHGASKDEILRFFNEDNKLHDIDVSELNVGRRTASVTLANLQEAISCIQRHKSLMRGSEVRIEVLDDDMGEDEVDRPITRGGGPGEKQQAPQHGFHNKGQGGGYGGQQQRHQGTTSTGGPVRSEPPKKEAPKEEKKSEPAHSSPKKPGEQSHTAEKQPVTAPAHTTQASKEPAHQVPQPTTTASKPQTAGAPGGEKTAPTQATKPQPKPQPPRQTGPPKPTKIIQNVSMSGWD